MKCWNSNRIIYDVGKVAAAMHIRDKTKQERKDGRGEGQGQSDDGDSNGEIHGPSTFLIRQGRLAKVFPERRLGLPCVFFETAHRGLCCYT